MAEAAAPQTVFERHIPSPKCYDFNVIGPIGEPEEYQDLLQVMRTAQEGDTLNLYMNTPGGAAHTMIQIINGMRNTNAQVIAHLEGLCHSAGTFIFLAADSWVINPNCLLLFHSYSGGSWGEGHKLIASTLAQDKWLKQICDDIYFPFLSREEIDTINRGEDLWLTSDEVELRLETLVEHREGLAKEAQEAAIQKVKDAFEADEIK